MVEVRAAQPHVLAQLERATDVTVLLAFVVYIDWIRLVIKLLKA